MGTQLTLAISDAGFGPSMNMTGVMLASWWANRPPGEAMAGRDAGSPAPHARVRALFAVL